MELEIRVVLINISDESKVPKEFKEYSVDLRNTLEEALERVRKREDRKIDWEYFIQLSPAIPRNEWSLDEPLDIISWYGEKVPRGFMKAEISREVGRRIIYEIKNLEYHTRELEKILTKLKEDPHVKEVEEMSLELYCSFEPEILIFPLSEKIRALKEEEIKEKVMKVWLHNCLIDELRKIRAYGLLGSEIFPSIFVKNKGDLRNMFYTTFSVATQVISRMLPHILSRGPFLSVDPFLRFTIELRDEYGKSFIGTFLDTIDYKEILEKWDEIKRNFRKDIPEDYFNMVKTILKSLLLYLGDKKLQASLREKTNLGLELSRKPEIWEKAPEMDFYEFQKRELLEEPFIIKVPYKELLERHLPKTLQDNLDDLLT